MSFDDLQEALRVLDLGEQATLKEIKTRHRALVKHHHPDSGNVSDPEIIRKVNASYRLLLDYITAYRFSFSEDEFFEQNPEARMQVQFADDPIWGNR